MTLPLKPPVLPQLARSRQDPADRRRLELRAQVGRLPLDRVRRRRRRLPAVAQRQAADAATSPSSSFPAGRYVLDGEIVLFDEQGRQDFDALGQRIHPAESRIDMLAEQTPTRFIAFDLLADGDEVAARAARRPSAATGWRQLVDKPVDLTPRDDRPGRRAGVAAGRRGRDRQGPGRAVPARRAHRAW